MKLVVTIDTEEDDRGVYSPTCYSVANTEQIPELQRLLMQFDVRPTCLLDYAVATHARSVEILTRLREARQCEIGTQCPRGTRRRSTNRGSSETRCYATSPCPSSFKRCNACTRQS